MAVTGVVYLTSIAVPPSSAQSPATTILSHLSDLYPTQTKTPFNIDHRLFVSTSSLLPPGDTKRTFTHFFTSSHSPQKTYVGTTTTSSVTQEPEDVTTKKSNNGLSVITIPTSVSLEPFIALIYQKLQPQWAPRQSVLLDNGATFTLPISDTAKWTISVGDMRVAPSKAAGPATGQFRGVVLEVVHEDYTDTSDEPLSDEEEKRYEMLFRELFKTLFKQLKLQLKLEDAKFHLLRTSSVKPSEEDQRDSNKRVDSQNGRLRQDHLNKPPGHEIAELYMDVLRGPRG